MYIYIIVILFLVCIYYLFKSENFISFMANLSEYGPQPIIICTKYIKNTNNIKILEIYSNHTYKIYIESNVLEGMIPDNIWRTIELAMDIGKKYNGKKYSQQDGINLTYHNIWINGYNINLGIFAKKDMPSDLYQLKEIFTLL